MIVANLARKTAARLATIEDHRSVRDTADLFADGRLGLVIVCDAVGLVVGVVSKSDLVRFLAQDGDIGLAVTAVMTRSVIAGSPADELRGTWELMTRRRLQNLPLLAPNRRPVGTLDIRDALQAMVEFEQEEETQLINYIAGVGYH
jgi:CBS-domain-containing membrane protein